MKNQKHAITVRTATGLEHWLARTDQEWISLALELYPQYLLDRGVDLDSINFAQAVEALTHDYREVEVG